MPATLLGLPPVPPALKSITPFLQRAEEVRSQDLIIAYWCAYYAAQTGISLKARDANSRNLLVELLGVLERMKKDIGSNDAVDVEVASVAYIENFALKVFAVADNEDRRGEATRLTAKKFLAAANFLEVLKVFPKTEFLESNEEKIRYAKWKAADIAKAIRDGRKPVPGPAVPDVHVEAALDLVPQVDAPMIVTTTPPRSPPHLHSASTPPRRPSPPNFTRNIPPPLANVSDAATLETPPRSTHLGAWDTVATPGNWSTIATPGTAQRPSHAEEWGDQQEWVNSPTPNRTADMDIGELSPTLRSPSQFSAERAPRSDGISPPGTSPPHEHSFGLPSSPIVRESVFPPQFTAPELPYTGRAPIHAPPPPAPPQSVDVAVELTPAVIAKAQKHARFAISALDYEDQEQAKKELRTALAILGGR